MHLILCNERLLFRFGVDRVLLLLAGRLKAAGWKISFVAQRADVDALRRISDGIHVPPAHHVPYPELDRATAQWLKAHRHRLVDGRDGAGGTIALIGGWPFYGCIPVFRECGATVVALDCGAVPVDGMCGEALFVQQRLRELRREYLPEAHAIAPISHFIERTQSRPDAGLSVRVATIHLGADHLDAGDALWTGDAGTKRAAAWPADRQRRRILNLGRWETGNYKNSEAFCRLARGIAARFPDAVFGVLANAADLDVPEDLRDRILPLGHVGDAELAHLMREADLGLSVSLWEGFNLPLAEMQQAGRPALAFDLGAHPEVVAHPRLLCRNEREMLDKAIACLSGDWIAAPDWAAALDAFRKRLNWQNTTQAYVDLLCGLRPHAHPPWPGIVVDASACLRDPANTGVARVVRSLSRKLQDFGEPIFVAWDERLQCYVLPTEDEYRNLGNYGGPDPSPAHYVLRRSPPTRRTRLASAYGNRLRGGWLLQGEIVFEAQGPLRREAARALGLKLAAIFYDAIPVTHPQWVSDRKIRENHAAYMRGLAECDRVLAISPDAGGQLKRFWQESGIRPKAVAETCWIPGELTASPRASTAARPPAPGERLRLLCVSTLEPRKNHRTVLAAVAELSMRHPDLDWQLDLVGNRYAGGDDIVRSVEAAAARDHRIVWHGVVDDATLNRFYVQAHITIYASLVEGYGMPIVESLWHGRPCICHREGVMADLAADGGCRTVDMTNPSALAEAIHALATDASDYGALAEAALQRHIPTWRSYARAVSTRLATHREDRPGQPWPERWQHWLLPASAAIADDPAQLALACLIRAQSLHAGVLVGEHPAWLADLFGAALPQAWQVVEAGTVGGPHRANGLSRLEGPLPETLSALVEELSSADAAARLVVLSAGLVARLRPALEAAPAVRDMLLVIPAGDAALAEANGFGQPAIRLEGYLGYWLGADSREAAASS
ncbi:MAG: glycosyltransferase [Rhodocyclaceae bacterium]|nr:glycosyltransferase [Rhodocyclaceae bacterium]